MFLEIFRVLFFCFAIVYIIVKTKGPKKVFNRLRVRWDATFLGDLISCEYCLSCWVCPPATVLFFYDTPASLWRVFLLDGIFILGVLCFLFVLVNFLEDAGKSLWELAQSSRSMSTFYSRQVMLAEAKFSEVE